MSIVHVGVRIPQEQLEAVDAFAANHAKRLGLKVTRSDAIRLLLDRGLLRRKIPCPSCRKAR